MTTLMWDGKTRTLLADTRTTFSNSRRKVLVDGGSKILRLERDDVIYWDQRRDERIIMMGGAGNTGTIAFLRREILKKGAAIREYGELFEDLKHMLAATGRAAVLVVTTRRCHLVEFPKTDRGVSITTTEHSENVYVGNGAEIAELGAETLGLTCQQAMILARCHDGATGGAIEAATLSDDATGLMWGTIPLISEADDFNTVRRAISRLPERESPPYDQRLYGANSEIQAVVKALQPKPEAE